MNQADFERLNRLRVNAGKTELKSWKASQERLEEAIAVLVDAGVKDTVPGADVEARPQTDDPLIQKVLPLEDPPEPKILNGDKEPTKVKSGLSRGLDGAKEAVHCRKSLADQRRKENVKLSPQDQQQIKSEAELRKGEVDPKKDPEKAARQKKHIEDKQKARAAAGKVGKRKGVASDEVSVADIARDLGMNPKIARAKLRRHEDKISKLHTKGQDRWTFPKSARKEIENILK